jgi:ribonuclease VapC
LLRAIIEVVQTQNNSCNLDHVRIKPPSLINLGEILYLVEREQGLTAAQRALAALDQLPVQVQQADRGAVLSAARVRARYPISYADAFAVAVAQEQQAVLLTGDPEFKRLETDGALKVEWLPLR